MVASYYWGVLRVSGRMAKAQFAILFGERFTRAMA